MNNIKYSVIARDRWHRLLLRGAIPGLLLTAALSAGSTLAKEGDQPSAKLLNLTPVSVEETSSIATPQKISQTENVSPEEVRRIRQELLIEPLVKTQPRAAQKPTYPPGLTFAGVSAFGANTGDVFIGVTGTTAGKLRDTVDGGINVGAGIGDSSKFAALELAFSNNSIRKFGANGSFDLKVHRLVYSQGNNQVAVAAGWNYFAQYGTDGVTPSGVYGVVTSYSLLQPDDEVNKMPISFSLGAGGGPFRQGAASTGVFSSVGMQVHPQVGVGLGWSGVGFNLGASYVPVPTIPLTITAQGADITNNSPGGTILSLSVSYGFNFLPK
ncbi:hypothetical protein [Cylindrospermopsis raciborskii]|uniref:hypothetical protein n=1 Tax=Cylindrospermopsis raciborskii TaxID=77022 RepID=UPI000778B274|nr:hypothetical protein [Cylindrospermopsis raciborskii]MCZ2207199.1 hypothetical protein [Cylindrospermopsis raciborskii PAMP2011]